MSIANLNSTISNDDAFMKFKNKLQIIAFFVAILMLAACNKQSKNTKITPIPALPPTPAAVLIPRVPPTPPLPPTPPPVPVSPSPKQAGIVGQWIIQCAISKDAPGYYYRELFSIDGYTMQTKITYYKMGVPGSETCTPKTASFMAQFDANFVLGKITDPGSFDQLTDISITKNKVQITPMDPIDVQRFNDPQWNAGVYTGFGKTNWQLWAQKDVTALSEAIKDFHIGTALPNIFQISPYLKIPDMIMLRMGDKDGNLDPDGRPMSLDNKAIALFMQ